MGVRRVGAPLPSKCAQCWFAGTPPARAQANPNPLRIVGPRALSREAAALGAALEGFVDGALRRRLDPRRGARPLVHRPAVEVARVPLAMDNGDESCREAATVRDEVLQLFDLSAALVLKRE